MPAEVAEEIKEQDKRDKQKGGPLDCVASLSGKSDRQAFVIKVYSIMSLQLVITAAFTAYVLYDEKLADWM